MNIRALTASAIVLAALTSGALAGDNADFINKSGVGLSDNEASYNIGRSGSNYAADVEVGAKAFAAPAPRGPIGAFIDETPAESNQRSSNR
jgi:hypothetical protein